MPEPIQNKISFSGNQVNTYGESVTLADIAAASGYSVEEIRANNPWMAGLSTNQPISLSNIVILPGNPRTVTQLPPGAYVPGSQVTPPPENGLVPEPYLIRTEDDLLRWMWVHEWGYKATDYAKSKAETRFKDFVEDKVQGMFTQLMSQETSVLPNSGSAEVNSLFNQLMAVEGQGLYFEQLSAMLDGLTLDQLMALRNEAEKAGQGNQDNYAFAPDEFLEYYDSIQALEQGDDLPYETHENYDPQLALHDYFDRHFHSRNPDDIERELIDLALAQIVMLHGGIEAVTDEKMYDAFREELFQRLGTKSPTIEQLITCLEELIDERVADDQSVEANYDELSIELPHVYDITVQYHDALALDKLRQIAYDSTWNPGEETRQLAELYVAIKQMTRTIMGVDVGFLQSSLFQFHDAVKDAHEWRLNLKASLDNIEAEMLERRDEESEPLWWLLEIPLSILVEPLDWLFTIRDLMLGDWSALIGFLPLVPGALRHIADAGRYLRGASDELVDALKIINDVSRKADDVDDMLRRIELNAYPWTNSIVPDSNLNLFEEVYDSKLKRGYLVPNELAIRLGFNDIEEFQNIIRKGKFGVDLSYLNEGVLTSGRFPIEFMAVYDKNGKYIAAIKGYTEINNNTIKFTVMLNGSPEIGFTLFDPDKVKGGYMTHYHPSPISFSTADVATMINLRFAELRAFSDGPTFVLRANLDDISDVTKFELIEYINKMFSDEQRNAMNKLRTNDIYDLDPDFYHQLWESMFNNLSGRFLDDNGKKIIFEYLKIES